MKGKTEELINSYYDQLDDGSPLKLIFKEVLVYYLEFHNTPTDIVSIGDESLFCTIHNYFESEDSHNCVGCNMNESNRRIENFLLGYRYFRDYYATLSTFIFLLYLQVEQIFQYFDIVQLPNEYKLEHFRVFYDVKRWANFLKHPKQFNLVHHPNWVYESPDYVSSGNTPVIDTVFVNRFYAGEKRKEELSSLLFNKQDLEVLFPNPLELIHAFCEAQKRFVLLIRDNPHVREILNDKATIREFYESLSDSDT
ncbi:hypothetical protein [Edaphocola aurantiacus]|uniref:hypothetical protein n=1 Tax=Edaphocola aurantiacus TaxID=2601682 RepID=UPI001C961258|nr:hypothetical protein [Edaphocola aurantiacus]